VNGDCIPHERDGAADPSVDLFDEPRHRVSVEIGVVCEEVKMETKMGSEQESVRHPRFYRVSGVLGRRAD
jgi:hypothetical protein